MNSIYLRVTNIITIKVKSFFTFIWVRYDYNLENSSPSNSKNALGFFSVCRGCAWSPGKITETVFFYKGMSLSSMHFSRWFSKMGNKEAFIWSDSNQIILNPLIHNWWHLESFLKRHHWAYIWHRLFKHRESNWLDRKERFLEVSLYNVSFSICTHNCKVGLLAQESYIFNLIIMSLV